MVNFENSAGLSKLCALCETAFAWCSTVPWSQKEQDRMHGRTLFDLQEGFVFFALGTVKSIFCKWEAMTISSIKSPLFTLFVPKTYSLSRRLGPRPWQQWGENLRSVHVSLNKRCRAQDAKMPRCKKRDSYIVLTIFWYFTYFHIQIATKTSAAP